MHRRTVCAVLQWKIYRPSLVTATVTPRMTNEHTYLRDSEWASIEGKLCLATAFVPMSGSIVNDAVVALDQTTPYAGVRLKVADYHGDITGYITNKLDFAMLWAATTTP